LLQALATTGRLAEAAKLQVQVLKDQDAAVQRWEALKLRACEAAVCFCIDLRSSPVFTVTLDAQTCRIPNMQSDGNGKKIVVDVISALTLDMHQ
jgi:hypothetical protein